MSLATNLRTIAARLDAAIAGRRSYGRVDLDRLRRELRSIADDADTEDQRADRDRRSMAELVQFDRPIGGGGSGRPIGIDARPAQVRS
jgi:hypothetical protein